MILDSPDLESEHVRWFYGSTDLVLRSHEFGLSCATIASNHHLEPVTVEMHVFVVHVLLIELSLSETTPTHHLLDRFLRKKLLRFIIFKPTLFVSIKIGPNESRCSRACSKPVTIMTAE